MAPKPHLRWLYAELPTLVSEEVLSAEDAARVQSYYGALETRGRSSLGIVICSILGGVLIGAGIILLFAHNWQQLSRPLRTVLALLPLVIAQGLTGWAIVRHPASAAWREGASVFLLTMIGASIALVGQTYHIHGDMARFLLTWMLLSLPLVYLAEASVVAALVWIGATCWAAVARGQGESAVFFWPLAAAVVPHLCMTCRTHASGMRAVLLGWVLCLCLSIATAITLEQQIRGVWFVVYAGLFTGLYLVDAWAYDPQLAFLRRPFRLVGAGGIAYLAVLGTYRWVWRRLAWSDVQQRWLKHAEAMSYESVVVLCGVLVTVVLLVLLLRRRRTDTLLYGVFALVTTSTFVAVMLGMPVALAVLLFNMYTVVMSCLTIRAGLRQHQLGLVNGGLLLLSVLIAVRFFDVDLSVVLRGIVFIVLGIAFLVMNIVLKRREVTA